MTCRREPGVLLSRIGRARSNGAHARNDAIIWILIATSTFIATYDHGAWQLVPAAALGLALRSMINATAFYAWASGYATAINNLLDGAFVVVHGHDPDEPCPADDDHREDRP